MKRKSTLTLAAAMLVLLGAAVSCGSADDTQTAVTTEAMKSAETTEAVTEDVYPYETPDMGGYALRILNSDDLWDMFMKVDVEETTGEVLNDAVYARNRAVEEKLNCTFDVTLVDIAGAGNDIAVMTKVIQETVLAGEDLYDVMYSSVYTTPAMVTDGYFMNLLDLDGLNFGEVWWDPIVAENATINDCLYFATSPMHLMSYDSTWILFFNETMMDKNDMEKPYDMVRNGTWTYDALLSYCKAITNMNGDASFTWDKNGNAVYGISAHSNCSDKFILGAGEYYIDKGKDGSLTFAATDERFHNVLSKLAGILDLSTGYTIYGSNTDFDADLGGYVYVFSVGRALFMTGEIKAAQELRDMNDTFGIVPYPKYDESQDSYYHSFVSQCMYYTVPVTNTHLTETAVISDYTSYLSYRDVLPVFYDNVVEQKGLRNEDSIEMLDIALSTETVDLAFLFGWSSSLVDTIRTNLFKGQTDYASTIEKQKKSIDKKIDQTLEAIENTKGNL